MKFRWKNLTTQLKFAKSNTNNLQTHAHLQYNSNFFLSMCISSCNLHLYCHTPLFLYGLPLHYTDLYLYPEKISPLNSREQLPDQNT